MDVRQLRYFREAAGELNISRAASRLFISQQGLSKALRSLEDELGCRLFTRHRGGISLTEAGERLAEVVDGVIEAHDGMMSAMRPYAEVAGELTLAVGSGAGVLLPPGISDGCSPIPQVRLLSVVERPNEACHEMVANGQADFAIVSRLDGSERRLSLSDACDLELSLLAPPGHPLLEMGQLLVSDLDGVNVVLCDWQVRTLLHHFGSQGVRLSVLSTTADELTRLQECLTRKACCIVISKGVPLIAEECMRVVPVVGPGMGLPISVACGKGRALSGAERAFRSFLCESLRSSSEGHARGPMPP